MNQINSIEQFSIVLTDILTRLRNIGDVALPCPAPQPWNDARNSAVYQADGPRYVVPDWRFSCFPQYETVQSVNYCAGIRVSVNVSNATMGGHSKTMIVASPEDLEAALGELVAFRDEALKKCNHRNHRFDANLGRCYNRYVCNDCGVKFEIDSSD